MVTFTEIINAILAPSWLVSKIPIIGLVFSVVLLVYFGTWTHHTIGLPVADWLRNKTQGKLSTTETVRKRPWIAKYTAEFIATIIFILYCYFGSYLVAEYLITPILARVSSIITLIFIALFLVTSYFINNLRLRKKFMGM